jgi:AcrR family transcriptional regulator
MRRATPPHLRADAQRNRDTLVATARTLFAERGLDVSMNEIAKRAGVGSGTLYRHFATREDLVTAVFVDEIAENVAAVERALEDDDPWRGFTVYVRATASFQATGQALADLFAIGHPSREMRALHTRGYRGFSELIARAQAAGYLRADFTPEDLVLLYMAIAGVTRYAGRTAPAAVERFVAFVLDGYRAEAATPAPPPIPQRTMAVRLREVARAWLHRPSRDQ